MALAGKKYFNALGRSACARGLPITESRNMRQNWNRWAWQLAREALSSTPKQSLAEHDNQIIQMCADKAEEMALYAGIDIAEAIRLLKVTP